MPKPIIGFFEIRKSPIIFIVEGQLDHLTLRQWGYPAVCASGSTIKDYALRALEGKEIVVVPDLDDGPGMKAANAYKKFFGERCTILDYSELREDDQKLDVSRLAERDDGEQQFEQTVRSKLPWIMSMSSETRRKWLPISLTSQ